jgi:aspartate-semialdehyde dehydrogenase
VVGAISATGQKLLAALSNHPLLHVTKLAAPPRWANRRYIDAIRQPGGQIGWHAGAPLDPRIGEIEVEEADALDAGEVDLVFSCLEATPARELEPAYAERAPVISTASAFRLESDVPILVPGVNPDHAALLRRARGRGKGFVAAGPSSAATGLAIALAPLARRFGLVRAHVASLQPVSGAGRAPGALALDTLDNLIPFIPKEEERLAAETRKILGAVDGDTIAPAGFPVSVTCARVPVTEGNTQAVHVELAAEAEREEIAEAWESLGAELTARGHPSAPPALIHVHGDPFRPQVRLDRDMGRGMTTGIGRLRRDPAVERGWKFVVVSHDAGMAGALGCVLLAEVLLAEGLIAPAPG